MYIHIYTYIYIYIYIHMYIHIYKHIFTHVAWHMCDTTDICDMTHSYVRHDSFIWKT